MGLRIQLKRANPSDIGYRGPSEEVGSHRVNSSTS